MKKLTTAIMVIVIILIIAMEHLLTEQVVLTNLNLVNTMMVL